MQKKTIESADWNTFLEEFSNRNTGRRARFEAFIGDGVAEEDEEGSFAAVSIDNDVVTVNRLSAKGREITNRVDNVHGIAVQYDLDDSENTIEFMDTNGDMTVLHFESQVDGDS
ncbi:MAG: hypothetical protein IT174_13525 [Acidobacteria bacterium]|nr:hypothetical protein [Acidobacteriota bacterium]